MSSLVHGEQGKTEMQKQQEPAVWCIWSECRREVRWERSGTLRQYWFVAFWTREMWLEDVVQVAGQERDAVVQKGEAS